MSTAEEMNARLRDLHGAMRARAEDLADSADSAGPAVTQAGVHRDGLPKLFMLAEELSFDDPDYVGSETIAKLLQDVIRMGRQRGLSDEFWTETHGSWTPLVEDASGWRPMTGEEALQAVRRYVTVIEKLRTIVGTDHDAGGMAAHVILAVDEPADPWTEPATAVHVADVKRALDLAPKVRLSPPAKLRFTPQRATLDQLTAAAMFGRSSGKSNLIGQMVKAIEDGEAQGFVLDPKQAATWLDPRPLLADHPAAGGGAELLLAGCDTIGRPDLYPAGGTASEICDEFLPAGERDGLPAIIATLGALVADGRVDIVPSDDGPVYRGIAGEPIDDDNLRPHVPLAVAVAEKLDSHPGGCELIDLKNWIAENYRLPDDAEPSLLHLAIALGWLGSKGLAVQPDAHGRYYAVRHLPGGAL